MKRNILLVCFISAWSSISAQQTFTVTVSGFTFSPALINAKVEDMVTFSVGSNHPVLQVSEATYLANGNSALSGGFSFPSGSGTITLHEPGTLYYICKNHFSSGMKGKIEISETTDLPKTATGSGFDIFPNPVDDYLNIKNPGSSNLLAVNVYDISGKVILKADQFESGDQNRLFVKNLRKGLYFISVSYADKTYTRKFLKL
jgi:plastocyanin